MRRLVVEISEEAFTKFEDRPFLKIVKSYEIVHLLRFDSEEFAAVVKIEFKDRSFTIQDLFTDFKKAKIQLLEEGKKGASTYFIAGKPAQSVTEDMAEKTLFAFGGYISTPFEIRDGKIKIAVLGETKQLKALMQTAEEIGLPFKVVSLNDARFSLESPLNQLTEKQRTVIVTSFEHGYFESPKKISNQELAKKLNMKTSTLVEHRRKAEQRILFQIIKES